MDNMTGDVSIEQVYNLVDRKVSEVNSSIGRVESKVDDLGSGRISSLEKQVANINGRLMYIPTIISIAIGAFFFIVQLLLKK